MARVFVVLLAVLSTLFGGSTALADRRQSSSFAQQLAFGVAWYPEQWPEERWGADLRLMQSANFNVVRIGEFAWSRMEPADGQFDFAWMDRAIAAAAKHGLRVVLGTPTAAPPAWLTQAHPDTLRIDEAGVRAEHGGRRQFSFASATYRRYARRIASVMAQRYGHDPRVIGWQIDNEIGPPSFDAEAQERWHRWLAAKYGSIDELNRRWTTEYWSQHYDRFDQVPLHATGQQNPGLLLDFKHFATDTWTDYIAEQAAAIRAYASPRQFITTNTMFWNAGFDHYKLHRVLDLAAWDNYIPNGRPDWVSNGANHDLVRGYKQRNFWLMETQPGRVDWVPVNRTLDPGQVREMAWQAVGHGADAVLYWQWRSALNGQEQYHGTLLGADGTPQPIFDEVKRTGAELAKAAPVLEGTTPSARVAMIFSYDSRWAIDLQRHHKDFDPVQQFLSWYRPLRVKAQAVDIVSPDAALDQYAIVVAPSLNVMTAAQAARLAAYVRKGGHLVLGPRSGMKDSANALWPARQPGPLTGLLGARVEQFYALDDQVPVAGSFGAGTATIWAETLTPIAHDAEIMERYEKDSGWLDGKAAVVTRRVGRGSITYAGAWFDPDTMTRIATRLLNDSGVTPILKNVADTIEVAERSTGGRRVLIIINHGTEAQALTLPVGAQPIVSGDLREARLAPHGVTVVELPAPAGAHTR